MFLQMFRNRIYESRRFKNRIRKLESIIKSNSSRREEDIVDIFIKMWNSQGTIDLPFFVLNRLHYDMWIDFHQFFTHGKPFVRVCDQVKVNPDEWIRYETEFGDVAIVVEYLLEDICLSRRISVLQTKKEQKPNSVDIPLHQLFLMQYWPSLKMGASYFQFQNVTPDEFSFYHFILNKSINPNFSSSICSAPFVGSQLGITKANLVTQLKQWVSQKEYGSAKPPPSAPLNMGLIPGSMYTRSKYARWNLIPKPFSRFLLDAAYLFVGTDDEEVMSVLKARVPTLLTLQIVGASDKQDWLRSHERSDQ